MFLTKFFKIKCTHSKITPDMEFGYCPDCGKLIRNDWYITRCACCGVRIPAVIINGVVQPANNYCSNCGSKDYIVEKLDKINFVDVHYAVLCKTELDEPEATSTTQCWQERKTEQPKLLVQYL